MAPRSLSFSAGASSPAPTSTAEPVRPAPVVSPMTATACTLTHEQREQLFTQALALEDAEKELAELRARLLAGLDAKAEALRQQRAQFFHCALTGTSPEAPAQLPLLEVASPAVPPAAPAEAASAPPSTEVTPAVQEKPEPEPSRGGARKKGGSRKGAMVTKRVAPEESGRRATAEASAGKATASDDAVPAPGVPCCTCTHSISSHLNEEGKCSQCRCEAFRGVEVPLPGAEGWMVRPVAGHGGRVRILVGMGRETLPLWWVEGYGLAFQNGEGLSCVFSHLGMSATTLTYEKDKRWKWVPREVLCALAEHLGAVWPDTAETPCECDGCGNTFNASELQPLGPEDACGYYCAGCKAEQEEQDGADTLRIEENRLLVEGNPLPAPAWAGALDASALLDATQGPRTSDLDWKDSLTASGTRLACQLCGGSSLDSPTPTRARLDFRRFHKPKGTRSWDASKVKGAGGIMFSRWLCQGCATPEKLGAEARRIQDMVAESMTSNPPEQSPDEKGEQPAKEETREDAPPVTDSAKKPAQPKKRKARAKAPAATAELALEATPTVAPAASSTGTSPPTPVEGWRVALPERHEGGVIRALRLWLVNDTARERKAATWWPSLGKLKCSHHLSGTLKGEEQAEHLALMGWWAENRDTVVAPLEEKCREGKVPGLKVYAPELLAEGPHRYALSEPWMLEVWEANKQDPARARFTCPTERGDVWQSFGDFTWRDGLLSSADIEAIRWGLSNQPLLHEAEGFISRGLVPEMLAGEEGALS